MDKPAVKAVYNSETGKIEYQPVRSILGDAVKRKDINRVGGYMNVYTNKEDQDLHDEHFDKETDFMDELGWSMVGKPILINHGLDDAFKAMHVGVFDFESEDEVGRYVEGRLYEQKEYEEMLEKLNKKHALGWSKSDIRQKASLAYKTVQAFFATGKAHWSSGALPQSVEVDPEDGHIKRWPRIEGSATYTPAEPDGTEVLIKGVVPNYEYTLKAAFDELSNILNSIQPAQAQKDGIGHESARADNVEPNPAANPATTTTSTSQTDVDHTTIETNGENNMDIQAIVDVLSGLIADLQEQAEEMGVPEEEADKIAQEAVDATVAEETAKAEDDDEDEEMDDEQKAVELGKSAFRNLLSLVENHKKAAKSAKSAFAAQRKEWQMAQAGTGGLPAYSHSRNGGNGANQVQVKSRFHNWSAEDISFYLDVQRMTKGVYQTDHDIKLYREFADKAEREYNAGTLTLSPGAVKSINAIKADELNYSTQAGFGDEAVFTAWSETIWDKPRLDNEVVPLFEVIEMPSNPYEIVAESTDPTVYFVAETTDETQLGRNDSASAIPDSKIGSAKLQLNAKKHALRVNMSAELEEDGIRANFPKYRMQAERAILNSHDNAVLVGDTAASGNINLDGGTPGTTASYKAYDGLVKQALVTASTNALNAQGGAPTLSNLRATRALLGSPEGKDVKNLAWIVDFSTYMKLLNANEIQTIDKYGPQATVLTGELGKIDGIPVLVSAEMALADTDGKVTNGGNVTDTGRALIVHRPTWKIGYRRRITQHMTFLPFADSWELVMTVRTALSARTYNSSGAQQSTDDSVAILYNIGV